MDERSGVMTIKLRNFKKQIIIESVPSDLLKIKAIAGTFSVSANSKKDKEGEFMEIILEPLDRKQYNDKKNKL